MNIETFGRLYQSAPIAFNAGATPIASPVPIDLSFLQRIFSNYSAPVVDRLNLRFVGEQAAAGGNVAAIDQPKIFSDVYVYDKDGPIIDHIPGSLLAVVAELENPGGTQPGAATTSGSTSTITEWTLPLYFSKPRRGARAADTAVELFRLVDGGGVRVSFAAPPNTIFAAGALVYLEAVVREEGRPEAKSRFRWSVQDIDQRERDNYLVGGSLYAAIASSRLTTTGYTSLTSALDGVDIKNFEFVGRTYQQFREEYRQNAVGLQSTDPFLVGNAVALHAAHQEQKIGQLPDIAMLNMRLPSSAPSGGALIVGRIEDRSPDMTARAFGYQSIAQFAAEVQKSGVTVSASKPNKSVTRWDVGLSKRLPMRLESPQFQRGKDA